MSFAILRIMLLGLLRDRGALAMAFALPPVIYVIFAAIFASATGSDLRLRVAVLDEVRTAASERLAQAMRDEPTFRITSQSPATITAVRAMIQRDEADVGVIIRADPAPAAARAPVLVIGDSSKAVAAPLVAGQIQRLFGEKLTDVSLRRTVAEIEQIVVPLNPEQRARADAVLDAMRRASVGDVSRVEARPDPARSAPLVERETMPNASRASPAVVYYAGAVAILFLMFSAVQGAMSVIDERQNGILDRLQAGAGGSAAIVTGKLLFLVGQGAVQVALIFLVAALAYGVDVLSVLPQWLAISVAASAAAAGFALALCSACSTRQQAQTLSNFLVLVLSAVGGSMVPRFLMPVWLQDLSWLIPNAWVIESYHGLLWRSATMHELALPLAMLLVFSAVSTTAAWVMLRRRQRSC